MSSKICNVVLFVSRFPVETSLRDANRIFRRDLATVDEPIMSTSLAARASAAASSKSTVAAQVATVEVKAKSKSDFSQRLSDEGMADMKWYFHPEMQGSNVECKATIISASEFQKSKGKTTTALQLWLPPMAIARSNLHGVGLLKSKFVELNVAGRYYYFVLTTNVPDALLHEINGGMQGVCPGYDMKADHVFANAQFKKFIAQSVDTLWAEPSFGKAWREAELKKLVEEYKEKISEELRDKKDEGKITATEYLEKLDELKAECARVTVDDPKFGPELFKRFKRELTKPQGEDEDKPLECAWSIKKRIFMAPRGAKPDAVPPAAVQVAYHKLVKAREDAYAAAGKKFILDKRAEWELTTIATRNVCEAAGYEYRQVEYGSSNSNAPSFTANNFLDIVAPSGSVVRVGVTISAQSTTGGKMSIRLMMVQDIKIVKLVPPKAFMEKPDSYGYGENWTIEGVERVVGKRERSDLFGVPGDTGSNAKKAKTGNLALTSDEGPSSHDVDDGELSDHEKAERAAMEVAP